jgi:hypothetical protein
MEVVAILASPQYGLGIQPSELMQMEIDDLFFWGMQLERVRVMVK